MAEIENKKDLDIAGSPGVNRKNSVEHSYSDSTRILRYLPIGKYISVDLVNGNTVYGTLSGVDLDDTLIIAERYFIPRLAIACIDVDPKSLD
jgi:hypothetical protein